MVIAGGAFNHGRIEFGFLRIGDDRRHKGERNEKERKGIIGVSLRKSSKLTNGGSFLPSRSLVVSKKCFRSFQPASAPSSKLVRAREGGRR